MSVLYAYLYIILCANVPWIWTRNVTIKGKKKHKYFPKINCNWNFMHTPWGILFFFVVKITQLFENVLSVQMCNKKPFSHSVKSLPLSTSPNVNLFISTRWNVRRKKSFLGGCFCFTLGYLNIIYLDHLTPFKVRIQSVSQSGLHYANFWRQFSTLPQPIPFALISKRCIKILF